MAKAFLDCGHVEPDDGARVLSLYGDLREVPLWMLKLGFCRDCAKRIDEALRAHRWYWDSRRPPVPSPTASVEQH